MDPYRALQAVPGPWGADAQRQKNRRILGGMIAALDRGVGTVLQAVDQAGVKDNTLVLFFSDNGGVGGIGSNYPLRGAKASVFEGGIRVPAAVRWPAGFQGGRKTAAPVANIDVLPTVLAAAGVHSAPGKPLDGINVLDVWSGNKERIGRELYNYIGQQGEDSEQVSVITPEWKLVASGAQHHRPQRRRIEARDPAIPDRARSQRNDRRGRPSSSHRRLAHGQSARVSRTAARQCGRAIRPGPRGLQSAQRVAPPPVGAQ